MGQIFVQPQQQVPMPWGAYAASRNRGGNDAGAAMMAELMRDKDDGGENALLVALIQMMMQQMGTRESNALALQLAKMQEHGAADRFNKTTGLENRQIDLLQQQVNDAIGWREKTYRTPEQIDEMITRRMQNDPDYLATKAFVENMKNEQERKEQSERTNLAEDSGQQMKLEQERQAVSSVGREKLQKKSSAERTAFRAVETLKPDLDELIGLLDEDMTYKETQKAERLLSDVMKEFENLDIDPSVAGYAYQKLLPGIDKLRNAVSGADWDYTRPIEDVAGWVNPLGPLFGIPARKIRASQEERAKQSWIDKLKTVRSSMVPKIDPSYMTELEIQAENQLLTEFQNAQQAGRQAKRGVLGAITGLSPEQAEIVAGDYLARYETSGPASVTPPVNTPTPNPQYKVKTSEENEAEMAEMLEIEKLRQLFATGGY